MKLLKHLGFNILCIVTLIMIGCSDPASSIQKDLDNNPSLKQKNIIAQVTEFKNGYVTVKVKGFRPATSAALKNGKSLEEIYMLVDMDIKVLDDVEEMIKKRPEVKGLIWTAD
jgi:hypothetical protein